MSTYLDRIFAGGRILAGGTGFPRPATVAQSYLSAEFRTASEEDREYRETVYPQRLTPVAGPSDIVTAVTPSNAAVTGQYEARLTAFGSPGSVAFDFRYSPQVVVDIPASALSRTRTGWAAGSLGEHLLADADLAILGKSPGAAVQSLYTEIKAGPLTRNPGSILAGVDISAISTWNTYGGNTRGGTVITPRHILCADHFPLPVGTVVHYQGNDAAHHTRTVVATQRAGDGDLRVCLLDADLPASVSPVPILPEDWTDFITTIEGLPCITTDKFRRAKIAASRDISLPPASSAVRWYAISPLDSPDIAGAADRAPWYSPAVSGDSGSPLFLLLGDDLILVALFHIPTGGSAPHHFAADINAAIAALDVAAGIATGYTLTRYDLSAFPTYP